MPPCIIQRSGNTSQTPTSVFSKGNFYPKSSSVGATNSNMIPKPRSIGQRMIKKNKHSSYDVEKDA
jgi:hypothetical protein